MVLTVIKTIGLWLFLSEVYTFFLTRFIAAMGSMAYLLPAVFLWSCLGAVIAWQRLCGIVQMAFTSPPGNFSFCRYWAPDFNVCSYGDRFTAVIHIACSHPGKPPGELPLGCILWLNTNRTQGYHPALFYIFGHGFSVIFSWPCDNAAREMKRSASSLILTRNKK